MDLFPSLKSVGDMLALGVNIEPEQEQLLESPDGRPLLTVWGLPDPMSMHEHSAPWCINGLPVVIPMILNNCPPSEPMGAGFAPWLPGQVTLLDATDAENNPFDSPVLVGERGDGEDLVYHRAMEVADGHFASPTWDLWPVGSEAEATAFNQAAWQAVDDSGYLQLVDYFGWMNGYDEPESIQQQQDVESLILGCNGELRDPDSFVVKLHLPREHLYTWERLIDLSQQGWQSYGLALSPEDRKRFFYPDGATPWF